MKLRGPVFTGGMQTTFDRSGSSSSPIREPLRHPFAVQCWGLADGKVEFAIHEGMVYTGSGVTKGLIGIDSSINVNAGPIGTWHDLTKLTNLNTSLFYSIPFSNDDKYLYVRAKKQPSGEWDYKLCCKTMADAEAEVQADPPTMVAGGETALGNASHGGFPQTLVASASACGITYTVTLTQQGRKFRATSTWSGTFQFPIGVFKKVAGNQVIFDQALRSDIYFGHTRQMAFEYIDTAALDLTMEASGTCCCDGCGCGCGGGGGCGECGCTGCGCTGCV